MFGLTHKFAKMMCSPRNAEEAAHVERHKVVQQWKGLDAKSKLTKELDPVAGQLLEAGSYYWRKITDTMATPAWQKDDLPAHWKSLRDQSLSVANAAMNELFMLLKDCTGKPSKTRKDDFQGAFENLTDLNFMDAALGLLTAATADASIYTFQSPYLPAVFEPAKQLAEKLRDLSSEIDELTKDVHNHVASIPGAATSVSSIDLILEEMKSVRIAERELREEEPPQQHIQH